LFNFYGKDKSSWGKNHKQLIICEGPGCVLRFHEAGFPGGVATFGHSLSQTQYFHLVGLLHRDLQVFIAGDTDEVGRKFAEWLKHELSGVCNPVVIYPPKGKDFGDASTEEVRAWMQGFVASHPVAKAGGRL
jgi:DNA primase